MGWSCGERCARSASCCACVASRQLPSFHKAVEECPRWSDQRFLNRLEVAVAVDESYSVRLNLENGRDALLSSVFSGVSLGEL